MRKAMQAESRLCSPILHCLYQHSRLRSYLNQAPIRRSRVNARPALRADH